MAARDEARDGVAQTFMNDVGKDVCRDPDSAERRRIIRTVAHRYKGTHWLSHRAQG
jgi:hypothetical protein